MGIVYSEESRLLKAAAIHAHGATVAVCSRGGREKNMRTQIVPVDELGQFLVPLLVEQPEGLNVWLSQSTLRPRAFNRRLSSVMLLNACWIDIDLAHPGESWLKKHPGSRVPQGDPQSLAHLLVQQLDDAGLPAPTHIVATGGGLCAKWLFSEPIHVAARARWQSVQTHILNAVEAIQVACDVGGGDVRWPVDRNASDAARILRLVGTVNPRWGNFCWVCWDGGVEYDFGDLADRVLPYSRAQVAAWVEASKEWKQWDKNRAMAAAAGMRKGMASAKKKTDQAQVDIDELLADEAARTLWVGRFEFGRAVIEARGGAKSTERNNLYWPMASALAWSCGGNEGQLKADLLALWQDLFQGGCDSWTRDEALNSASSVVRRLQEPMVSGKGNYRFKTSTWLERLAATQQEIKQFGHLLGGGGLKARGQCNAGAMSFEPMRGLSFDAYLAETRRRQALAGIRSAKVRKTNHGQEKREKAREMALSGLSQAAIAAGLGISQQTVSRWIR